MTKGGGEKRGGSGALQGALLFRHIYLKRMLGKELNKYLQLKTKFFTLFSKPTSPMQSPSGIPIAVFWCTAKPSNLRHQG